MLLAEVVAASGEVAATRSRLAKVNALAGVLRRAAAEGQVRPVAAWLSGETLQGRVGVGWRLLHTIRVEPAGTPSLTVADLTASLDRLAVMSGRKVTQARTAELSWLLSTATADEARFLVQLVGGELRQGALEGLMIEGVARAGEVDADAVRRAFMLSGRLPGTADLALTSDDPTAALAGVGLEVGRPIRPMLASPGDSLDHALDELGPPDGDPGVVVEQKYDGARIQVHRSGDEVHVYTRTLREITDSVPEIVALARSLPVTSVVLDGESLARRDDGRPRPFQETMARFGTTAGLDEDTARDVILQPWFFDCLHCDGTDLVDEPLSTRRDALIAIAPDHMIPAVVRPTREQATTAARESLAAGHEGSMVKALDSVYSAGRRGRAWQKVKPAHTLDLVVLAAEWGSGRRRGWLSNIHLGARSEGTDDEPTGFVMIGKTFKGMTDEILRWQTETFPTVESHRDRYAVHLRPEIVVEILVDGVQTSTRYPGGVALRFARVVRYRDDKPPAEADTIDTVRALLL